PVAVGRRTRLQPRQLLAGLPAPLRHRTHLPVPQEHPRLDHPRAAPPRTGRPLDLARPRRLHPAPPRPRPRRRPPPPMGTTTQTRPTPARARRGFRRLAQHWAPQPVHQNPEPPAQDAPKEPAQSDEPATQRSRRPPHQGLIASLGDRTSLLRRLARAEGLGPARKVAAPTLPPR